MNRLLILVFPVVLAAGEVPAPAPEPVDQPLTISAKMAAGAVAMDLQAPILPEWNKPIGDGFTLCGKRIAARVDAKGKLELDTDGKGTFHAVTAGSQQQVRVEREIEGKKRQQTMLIHLTRDGAGVWRWRNVGAVVVQIGDETLIAVDVNGDGHFNTPGADGLLWQGQAYAFPLPPSEERWCTAKLELTGFSMGPWGEDPKASGRTLATTFPAGLPILKGVNRERVQIGLTPRPENSQSSVDLQKHCHYMALNNQLGHGETAGKPGYSPEGNASGLRSILGSGTPGEYLAMGMVATLYHRTDVIRPQARAFGVGIEDGYAGIDGRKDLLPKMAVAWPVLCPARDQRGVPTNFRNESPDPISGDRQAGYPITAYFSTSKLKLKEASLIAMGKDGKPGPPIDCYRFDASEGGSPSFNSFSKFVALIAKDPLQGNLMYRVSMACEVDGKPQLLEWNFHTSR